MIKQVITICKNNKPVSVCEVKTIQSLDQLDSLKSECAVNKAEHDLAKKQEKDALLNRVSELERRVYLIEIELRLNRGEITEQEYEELCHGIR